jgi:hypothetical protein
MQAVIQIMLNIIHSIMLGNNKMNNTFISYHYMTLLPIVATAIFLSFYVIIIVILLCSLFKFTLVLNSVLLFF